jgi:hypothetical protein
MAPFDRIVVMAFLVIARFVPRDCQVVPTAVTNAAVGARYRRFWLGGERRARDKNEPAWCSLRGNCARLQSQSQLSRSQCTRAAIPCWCRRKASRLDLVLTSLPIISLSNVSLNCSVASGVVGQAPAARERLGLLSLNSPVAHDMELRIPGAWRDPAADPVPAKGIDVSGKLRVR